MKNRTDKRIEKLISVIKSRKPSLKLVLENIHDPHNVSAIFRTCDAAGIPKVSLIYNTEKFPKIGKKSSASAFKWVDRERFKTVEECFSKLKQDGFIICSSVISDEALNLYDIDFTEKIAFAFGNENRGLSEEAIRHSEIRFKIPMFGMVQSLNVSVSAAIVIYEALRQKLARGTYEEPGYAPEEINKILKEWTNK